MEDSGVLQHLLEIEAQAASLVDEAQAEADKRIRAAEEQNRLSFDKAYQSLVEELDAEHRASMDAARAEYEASLDEYRRSLDELPLDKTAFSNAARSFLVDGT